MGGFFGGGGGGGGSPAPAPQPSAPAPKPAPEPVSDKKTQSRYAGGKKELEAIEAAAKVAKKKLLGE